MIKLTNVSYISVIIAICVLVHLVGQGHCFGEDKTPKKHLLKDGWSPGGNIIIRYYVDGEDIYTYTGDIWLYSDKDLSKKELLFSFRHDADVLISPDEKWLVINHKLGPSRIDALLFQQLNGLKYKEIKLLNPQAWAIFKHAHTQYKLPEFHHIYVEAVQWSSDSKSVMIQVHGHDNNSPAATEPWYCIYDLTTGKMTLDFNRVFNRDTYHPDGKAKGRELFWN